MAHKKSGGSSNNGRDSEGRRLGIKKFGGETVIAGNIIVRQRGTSITLVKTSVWAKITPFAKIAGKVEFAKKSGDKTFVSVVAE